MKNFVLFFYKQYVKISHYFFGVSELWEEEVRF